MITNKLDGLFTTEDRRFLAAYKISLEKITDPLAAAQHDQIIAEHRAIELQRLLDEARKQLAEERASRARLGWCVFVGVMVGLVWVGWRLA